MSSKEKCRACNREFNVSDKTAHALMGLGPECYRKVISGEMSFRDLQQNGIDQFRIPRDQARFVRTNYFLDIWRAHWLNKADAGLWNLSSEDFISAREEYKHDTVDPIFNDPEYCPPGEDHFFPTDPNAKSIQKTISIFSLLTGKNYEQKKAFRDYQTDYMDATAKFAMPLARIGLDSAEGIDGFLVQEYLRNLSWSDSTEIASLYAHLNLEDEWDSEKFRPSCENAAAIFMTDAWLKTSSSDNFEDMIKEAGEIAVNNKISSKEDWDTILSAMKENEEYLKTQNANKEYSIICGGIYHSGDKERQRWLGILTSTDHNGKSYNHIGDYSDWINNHLGKGEAPYSVNSAIYALRSKDEMNVSMKNLLLAMKGKEKVTPQSVAPLFVGNFAHELRENHGVIATVFKVRNGKIEGIKLARKPEGEADEVNFGPLRAHLGLQYTFAKDQSPENYMSKEIESGVSYFAVVPSKVGSAKKHMGKDSVDEDNLLKGLNSAEIYHLEPQVKAKSDIRFKDDTMDSASDDSNFIVMKTTRTWFTSRSKISRSIIDMGTEDESFPIVDVPRRDFPEYVDRAALEVSNGAFRRRILGHQGNKATIFNAIRGDYGPNPASIFAAVEMQAERSAPDSQTMKALENIPTMARDFNTLSFNFDVKRFVKEGNAIHKGMALNRSARRFTNAEKTRQVNDALLELANIAHKTLKSQKK